MSEGLLEVISTRGIMSLADFDLAYDRLVPQKEGEDLSFARRSTLRALDSLGHCETDWGRQRLYACRPVFARLPTAGCPRVVLSGARVTQMVIDIKAYAKSHSNSADFSLAPQSDGLPDVVTLEVADEATLAECAVICRVSLAGQLPAAWTLANVSGCITDYEATLSWKPDAPLNWRWRIFDPVTAFFRRADDPNAVKLSSFTPRLTEHTNPITQQRECRWTKDGLYALVGRDWGRWLALAATNERVLLYDVRRQRLAAPSSVPLPRLLARAATLCSGRASYKDTNLRHNVYDSVPPTLADLIARKIGQSCKPANLEREVDHA